ncbi:odorant receptor 131-2-like [Mastacembelus armatus]|uniref:odorant receptor 131-2-like n=1 Tax=Mastacembelus armatus TaxID=205130 RepID=UPI000E462243|nr:odorant receptor 131-2-like [Mastacembelus armatus]
MATNNSLVDGDFLQRKVKIVIVQVLVMIFLCINLLLLTTFYKKECFHTTTRYILFAVTLLSDSLLLFMSDILLILTHFNFTMHVWLCVIMCVLVFLYLTVTPVTLTAMTLERYVAICMPLHHAELCNIRRTKHCILIIHSLSSVPCIVILSTFFASAPASLYKQYRICSLEIFVFYRWQSYLISAVYQFQFLIMCIVIVFSYVKIMKVAKSASGGNKKSTWKGLRTVVLHGFQLLLCLIQLWCPFIEAAILMINFSSFENVRYFNYITFYLAPRCLSPLIYGLRDETFSLALKHNACFGFYCVKNNVQISFV